MSEQKPNLRAIFAASAMQGMLANPKLAGSEEDYQRERTVAFSIDTQKSREALCFKAIQFADEMLATMEKHQAE